MRTIDGFKKIDMRVVNSLPFPRAKKPDLKVFVDLAQDIGIQATSAQIREYYTPSHLIGQQVIGVTNLPPRNIVGFMSEFLLLGLEGTNKAISLIQPNHPIPNGHYIK